MLGELTGHELKITDCLLKLMKEPDFYSVIYPHFRFIIPDACVIWKRGDQVKLTMLEIEENKGNWQEYIGDKMRKYKELSVKEDIHDKWWRYWAGIFGFNFCSIDEFGFEVKIYDASFNHVYY